MVLVYGDCYGSIECTIANDTQSILVSLSDVDYLVRCVGIVGALFPYVWEPKGFTLAWKKRQNGRLNK